MKKAHVWMLVGIIALGAFLRFYLITQVPLGLYPDEAMNGNNALESLATGHFKVFYPENNGREGMFINIQALSVATFGPTPWALRIVSALFGTLAILAVYLAAHEVFRRRGPALLAAFFLATSYWHLNFSRIGFRAIMVPLLAPLAIYFLLKGLRRGSTPDIVLAGIFTGLGLNTYIAFRLMAPVVALPLAWYLFRARSAKHKAQSEKSKSGEACAPCAVALYAFVVFVVTLPLAMYFVQNPHEITNRAGEISVFGAATPLKEMAKSTGLTIGMFFWHGDCNWRHNFNCAPALHPLAAFLFLVGIVALWRSDLDRWKKWLIAVWVVSMGLPAALTRESIPHALRSIGMIPPVMMLAGFGADRIRLGIGEWIAAQKKKWPRRQQLQRLRYELLILLTLALIIVPFSAYQTYFLTWSNNPKTYESFDTSNYHLGQYLASLPSDTRRYVIVNSRGVDVRGVPMPSQTIMFVTDSFTPAKQQEKNIHYIVAPPGVAQDPSVITTAGHTVIAFTDNTDIPGIAALQKLLPSFRPQVPGDFVIFQNY